MAGGRPVVDSGRRTDRMKISEKSFEEAIEAALLDS